MKIAGRDSCAENTPVLDILLVTFPFFALVLCGYIAARRRMLPFDAISGLNTFVLYFALPCMLYRFGASTPIAQLLDAAASAVSPAVRAGAGRLSWSGPAATRASAGTTPPSARWWRRFPTPVSWACRCWWRCSARAAAGPAILTILIDLVITSSLCIALSRLDGADEHGVEKAAEKRAQGRGPQPDALGHPAGRRRLGAADRAGEAGGADHRPAGRFGLAGGAVHHRRGAGALAVRRGAGGTRADAAARLRAGRGGQAGRASAAGLGRGQPGASCLGLPLDRFALTVMVLVAALPSASNVALLAERFGADNGRIARIILLTTAAAFLTFSGAVALLR